MGISLNLISLLEYDQAWLLGVAVVGILIAAGALLMVIQLCNPQATALKQKTWARFPTVRQRLLVGLCIVGIAPALSIPVILAAGSAGAAQQEAAAQLGGALQPIVANLNQQVEQQIARIRKFAGQLGAQEQIGRASLARWLQHFHDMNPELVTMLVADEKGQILAATAFADDHVREWNGPLAGVSDLQYFNQPMLTGLVFVSPATRGPAPRYDALVDISAPLTGTVSEPGSGMVRGIVHARLNLRKLSGAFGADESASGTFSVLTDENGRVILASEGVWFNAFDNLSDHPLLAPVVDGATAEGFTFSGLMEKNRGSGRYLAAHKQLENGWRVFRIQSLAGVQTTLFIQLVLALIWAAAAIWMCKRLATTLSEAVSVPLKKLDESLDNFDSEPTMRFIAKAPDDAPDEIQAVYGKVRKSLEKSRESYRTMMSAISEGEQLRQVMRSLNGGRSSEAGPVADQSPVEVFESALAKTWETCSAEGKSLSLLMIGIGDPSNAKAPPPAQEIMDAIAYILKDCVKGTAGFSGQADSHEVAIILPEADLEAALVVAEKARVAAQMTLASCDDKRIFTANIGVGTIVPNVKGDTIAFLRLTRRVLLTACQLGSSRIAHLNGKGKVSVLRASPDSPPMAQQKLSA